jgi:polyisoprenoid-binding protein YceI
MEPGMAIGNDGPVQFAIDARASLFTVQAFASGLVAVIAHSPKFAMREITGEIDFDAEAPIKSFVHVTIKLKSLEIMDEVKASERQEIERVMFNDVLETSVYPVVEFKSTRVGAAKTGESMYRVNVTGTLSLHGLSRGLSFDSQVVAGEDSIRAQGAFSLLQTDFGLKIASVAGGTLKLKDELKFGFFLVARRKS